MVHIGLSCDTPRERSCGLHWSCPFFFFSPIPELPLSLVPCLRARKHYRRGVSLSVPPFLPSVSHRRSHNLPGSHRGPPRHSETIASRLEGAISDCEIGQSTFHLLTFQFLLTFSFITSKQRLILFASSFVHLENRVFRKFLTKA